MSRDFDPSRFYHDFAAAAAVAGFTGERLLETADGPLMAWRKPADGPRIYLSAGIHGDEPAGPLGLLELLRAETFGPGPDWTLCPALNPTGLAAGARDSTTGGDLNRDYLARRSTEVRAHAAWLESQPTPDLFLSLHEDWETSGFYFYEINLGPDRPELARAILAAVAPWFAPEPESSIDNHDVREPGWIHHSAEADLPNLWPEAIFLAKRGCQLSFTFETPSRAPITARVAAHFAAVHAVTGSLL